MKERSKQKLARITWAGHVEKMGDEKQAKRADTQEVDGKMEARKPEIAMGGCIKSDLEKWEKNGK